MGPATIVEVEATAMRVEPLSSSWVGAVAVEVGTDAAVVEVEAAIMRVGVATIEISNQNHRFSPPRGRLTS